MATSHVRPCLRRPALLATSGAGNQGADGRVGKPRIGAHPSVEKMNPSYRWQVQPRFFVLVAAFLLLLVGLVAGGSALIAHVTRPQPPELPRGGRTLFPDHRLFGYSGYPGSTALGRLGTGDLDQRMAEIERAGADYVGDRKLLPVMELIAVTVHATPGSDGTFRTRASDDIIQRWLDAARRHKAVLLLNIQPGRASFIDEVRHLEKWLSQPDVGLALDPEWAVGPGQVPGKVFGHTSGEDLDAVSAFVAGLIAEHDLPEKVLLYHQLHENIVSDESSVAPRPGVVLIKSIDGIGSPQAKTDTWKRIVAKTPSGVHLGFKLFFEEDTRNNRRLMTPAEVMALSPTPEYILFE